MDLRRKLLGIGAALICLVLFAASLNAQSPEQPKPGPELNKLAVWVGDWAYNGVGKDSPFGPGGNFSGTSITRMILNGFFLEDRWRDKSDVGYVAEGITLTGYDSKAKTYIEQNLENDGSLSPATLTVDGPTWTSVGSRTDSKGVTYKMRVIRTLSPDGNTSKSKAEYSADGGKTWRLFWELTSKKTGR